MCVCVCIETDGGEGWREKKEEGGGGGGEEEEKEEEEEEGRERSKVLRSRD